ncbi:alpha/beta fold hydrolase [Kutzneria kofuensis]|uniref:Pimeloyl-ACP methyl ester carboxylesterase n=1 Tax=Kutzneria kofuensis TaxID=103725 RepID=A0A7W9NMC0_9PSEU|nr:alpha/beta fold hydrolase [Kutzneria kofuensis]MBB5897366.1 pimeloyl-ACP methyl ester carboxylesterase [Kutzneria kofuensis]
MNEHTIKAGGHEIFLAETGAGPAVVLLHGGGPGASGVPTYKANIDVLAKQFRVIVPDLPGYGRSSKTIDQEDPFGSLADAVRGVLDALGIDSATLVGNSYGGSAALRLALDTPSRVDRLVLMGPGGIGTTRAVPTKGLRRLLGYYPEPSREKLATFIREYLVFDGASVSESMIDERYRASLDPEVIANPPLRRPSNAKTLFRMDLTCDRRLRGLDVPTLVLWGTKDKVNRPSGGVALARLMPNCDLMLFANTGHWVQWEQADRFNRMVADFVGCPE